MPGAGVWIAAAAVLTFLALPAATAQPPPTIHVWPTVEPETKKEPYDVGPDREAHFNSTLHLEFDWPVYCLTETTINVTLALPAFPRWAGTSIGDPVYVEFAVGPGVVPPWEQTAPGPPIHMAWDKEEAVINTTVSYQFQAVIEEIAGPAGAPDVCSPRLSMMERDEGVALVNVTAAGPPAGADAEPLDGAARIPTPPTVAVLAAAGLGALLRRRGG